MAISEWLSERREAVSPRVHRLPWAQNREWQFHDGMLRHRTHAYFSIVGTQIHAPGTVFHDAETPMILQSEVGLLGSIVCATKDGPLWLLQAKLEPGTVNFVQAAPTVQATQSNYLRRHGGHTTPFLGFFHDAARPNLIDTLQSEQGSRFIGKFNRNAIRMVPTIVETPHPNWRWVGADAVRRSLVEDFAMNTDVRSVIACAPWRLLRAGALPFISATTAPHSAASRVRGAPVDFISELSVSYRDGGTDADRLLTRLKDVSNHCETRISRKPLISLRGWKKTDCGLAAQDQEADFAVTSYDVYAPEREVERWQQPLLNNLKEHKCGLVFQIRDGFLKTFLRTCAEPGFGRQAQFGPSYQSDGDNPRWVEELVVEDERAPLLSIRQSDEGGRFMHAIMRYSLHYIDDVTIEFAEGGEWVNIAELEALCSTPGTLTNEARSLVSLLLGLA
jgi:oxidase EvaA